MSVTNQQADTKRLLESEWPAWTAGKEFLHPDYVTNKLRLWCSFLSPLRERDLEVLEIGSLDGRSALFFLNYLPRSRITCIDRFFPDGQEAVFDRNLSQFKDRLEKLSTLSVPALVGLRRKERRFDLVYIDGDHRRETVMLDAMLTWPMLRPGGILIWDDYIYKPDAPLWERPTGAIDGFLVAHAGEYEELHRRKQIVVRKTVDAPPLRLNFDLCANPARRSSGWRKRLHRLLRAR
jgi:predicted O-methyltransferase YrrM